MIHMLQCLCGPARHAIVGMLYDDNNMTPQDVKDGLVALIEMQIDHGIMNRRCEICDKDVVEFWYEDGITKEQDWDRAQDQVKQSGVEQRLTQIMVKADRKAGKN